MPKPFDALKFLAHHGVVLASARGPVPSVAEAIAGSAIRGSWWGHPRGQEIFAALSTIADSPDAVCLRLVEGKISFVHRRLWPALVRLARELGRERLAALREEHTASGAHRTTSIPFPKWVPAEVKSAAKALSLQEAQALLPSGIAPAAEAPGSRKKPARASTSKRGAR